MIVLSPTSKGTTADQDAVPVAVPALPVEEVQATDVTPALSAAFPLSVIEAAEVETMVPPGERMLSVGGVVSPPPEGTGEEGFDGEVGVDGAVGADGDVGVGDEVPRCP